MKTSARFLESLWRCLRIAERNRDEVLRRVFIRLIQRYGGK